mmetsp:Transcript_24216/g.61953  ORF Transcript_24216/g.61953 Transcript_24216/m.61953 type:complete len:232 (-) Transcript_24216:1238-1933(-)
MLSAGLHNAVAARLVDELEVVLLDLERASVALELDGIPTRHAIEQLGDAHSPIILSLSLEAADAHAPPEEQRSRRTCRGMHRRGDFRRSLVLSRRRRVLRRSQRLRRCIICVDGKFGAFSSGGSGAGGSSGDSIRLAGGRSGPFIGHGRCLRRVPLRVEGIYGLKGRHRLGERGCVLRLRFGRERCRQTIGVMDKDDLAPLASDVRVMCAARLEFGQPLRWQRERVKCRFE